MSVTTNLLAFEGFKNAVEKNELSAAQKMEAIRWAAAYARKHKLAFDGTLKGVLKLAEQADRIYRDELAKQSRHNNGRVFGVSNPRYR